VLIDLDYQIFIDWATPCRSKISCQMEAKMGRIAFEAALYTWAIFGTTKAGLEPVVSGNPLGWIGIVTGVICLFVANHLHRKRMGR